MNFWKIVLGFWILFAAFVLFVYFFKPDIFHQMFSAYQGAGSPYINTPQK